MATKKTNTKSKKTTGGRKGAPKKAKNTEVTSAVAEAPEVKEQTPAETQAAAPAVKPAAAAPAVHEKAEAPAVKVEAEAPAVKEEAKAPAVKPEAEAPAVKAEAETPAVKEEAQAPAVKPDAQEQAKADETPAPVAAEKPAEAETRKGIVLKPNPDGSKLTPVLPRPMMMGNPYKPMIATVLEVIRETPNIKTIRVVLDDPEERANFTFEPGQVGQLSVFGVGESTFVINSIPSQKDYLQFSVMQAGEVTAAIHNLTPGDKVGVRAPLGRPWPYNDWKGKNLLFIGGGIGMAPVRTVLLYCLEHAEDYGKISLLYGGRSPQDLTYSYELDEWMNNPKLDCVLTIDRMAEGWPHKVGFIPDVLMGMNPSPDNCVAVLCGPPIMIKLTLGALDKLNFSHDNIYTTLEKRMKCGIGICGRCGIGGKYVCLDGPVFTMKQLDELPPEL